MPSKSQGKHVLWASVFKMITNQQLTAHSLDLHQLRTSALPFKGSPKNTKVYELYFKNQKPKSRYIRWVWQELTLRCCYKWTIALCEATLLNTAIYKNMGHMGNSKDGVYCYKVPHTHTHTDHKPQISDGQDPGWGGGGFGATSGHRSIGLIRLNGYICKYGRWLTVNYR